MRRIITRTSYDEVKAMNLTPGQKIIVNEGGFKTEYTFQGLGEQNLIVSYLKRDDPAELTRGRFRFETLGYHAKAPQTVTKNLPLNAISVEPPVKDEIPRMALEYNDRSWRIL